MATVIVQDTFTDTNGTSLDAHTPNTAPSGGWTERVGNWSINSNSTNLSGNSNNAHATIETGVADCTITCEADNNAGSGALGTETGIICRWSDTSNYWRVGVNAFDDTIKIIERNAATNTQRASGSVSGGVTGGTLYTVQAVLAAASITATVDGANSINYASATLNQTATIHGIAARTATTDRVDDFLVEADIGHPAMRRFAVSRFVRPVESGRKGVRVA